ncbi:MAG: hypothetical protein R3B99_37560 [Polyangiales bacterium]
MSDEDRGSVRRAVVSRVDAEGAVVVEGAGFEAVAENAVPFTAAAVGDEVLVAVDPLGATMIANLTRSRSKVLQLADRSGRAWLEIDLERESVSLLSHDGRVSIAARDIDAVASNIHRIDGGQVRINCDPPTPEPERA